MHDVLKDIAQAKREGSWSGREGQAGPSDLKTRPFWCERTKGALQGRKEALKECCDALRITPQSFLYNAFHEIPYFDVYQQIFYESMHGGALGNWVHLLRAIMYTYKKHLQRWTDAQGKAIISQSQWDGVLKRLQQRLLDISADSPALSVSPFLSEVGTRVDSQNDKPGKTSAGVRATEQHILMLTFAWCMPNLISPEIAVIKSYYAKHPEALQACLQRHDEAVATGDEALNTDARSKPAPTAVPGKGRRRARRACTDWNESDSEDEDGEGGVLRSAPRCKESFLEDVRVPHDPSDVLIEIVFEYSSINNDMRATRTDDDKLAANTLRVQRWKESVLKHLPFKSGQISGWNFIKFHYLDHAFEKVPWFGCLENVSAQTAELCHQEYVKTLGSMINRHPGWNCGALLRRARADLAKQLAAAERADSQKRQDSGKSGMASFSILCKLTEHLLMQHAWLLHRTSGCASKPGDIATLTAAVH